MKGHDEIMVLVLYFLSEGDNFKGKGKRTDKMNFSALQCREM